MKGEDATILVIDDEALIAKALSAKLQKEGFVVLVAKDGAEGLEMALDKHPDLILLDLILPIMDGMTILNQLRADSWGKSVPIIILTNLSKAETVVEGKKKGVTDYLVKTDWKLEEVVQKVKYELGII